MLALPQGIIAGAQAKPAAQKASDPPVGTNADTGWPRTAASRAAPLSGISHRSKSWAGQKQIVAWSAVSYQPTGAKEPALGTTTVDGRGPAAVGAGVNTNRTLFDEPERENLASGGDRNIFR